MTPNRPAVLFYILNMILMAESMTTPVYPGHGTNLQAQMFTLSQYGGGVSLYPPSFNPSSLSPSWTPYTTSYWPWKTTTAATLSLSTLLPSTIPDTRPTTLPTTTIAPSTTASPRGGVSVCVRYMVDMVDSGSWVPLFTLSPESGESRMVLAIMGYQPDAGIYKLTLGSDYYPQLTFRSNRQLWTSIRYSPWTNVCVTVDSSKGVAQVFQGGAMSIRKRLQTKYEWTGAPVIELSKIDGQLTDVQVWSSCLTTNDVYNYMSDGYGRDYRGSVLTWFDISYSLSGNALLEDMQEPINQKAVEPMRGEASESARLEKIMKRLFRKKEWDVSRMRDEGYMMRSSLVLVQ